LDEELIHGVLIARPEKERTSKQKLAKSLAIALKLS